MKHGEARALIMSREVWPDGVCFAAGREASQSLQHVYRS